MVRAGHKLFFRLSFLSRHQEGEPAVPGRLGERVRVCACARGLWGGGVGRAHLCEDEPCLEDGGTGGGGMSTGASLRFWRCAFLTHVAPVFACSRGGV